jgi:hypothetical protein
VLREPLGSGCGSESASYRRFSDDFQVDTRDCVAVRLSAARMRIPHRSG